MIVQQKSLKELLHSPNIYFSIPDFQRPYSWHPANIDTFLEDLESIIGNDKSHFFGSVVYQTEGDDRIIIDGQQRITTALLMIIAIYHIIEQNPELADEDNPSDRINEDFLFNKYHKDHRLRLKVISKDSDVFEKIYKGEIRGISNRNASLLKCYNRFVDHFQGKIADHGLDFRIYDYIEATDRFKLVSINLDSSDDEPQKIFESINATGESLSEGDKIRNFALMLNHQNARKAVAKRWQTIESHLIDSEKNKDDIADFFRKLLTSYYSKFVAIRRIHTTFKAYFKEKVVDHNDLDALTKFYDDVIAQLDRYRFLKTQDNDIHKYKAFTNAAFRLRHIQIELIYPFLMRVLERYDNQQLSKGQVNEIFYLSEVYLVRRALIDIQTSTGLNRFYATLDGRITNIIEPTIEDQEISEYVEVYKYLLIEQRFNFRLPLDEELGRQIEHYEFYSIPKPTQRLILSSYDDFQQPRESGVLRDITEGRRPLTIEHILPQKPDPGWAADVGGQRELEDLKRAYLNTLPNLTLTGYNSEYSNKIFSEKLNCSNGFLQSPLRINDYLKQCSLWDEKAILGRADWFLNEVIKNVWPYPKTKFQPADETRLSLGSMNVSQAGTRPRGLVFREGEYRVQNWSELTGKFLELLFDEIGEDRFLQVINNDQIARFISRYESDFRTSAAIGETGYFIDVHNGTDVKIDLLQKLARLLEFDQDKILIDVS